jgi:hypothetical protein
LARLKNFMAQAVDIRIEWPTSRYEFGQVRVWAA